MAFRATMSFGYSPGVGERNRVVAEGTVVSDDDPAVKRYPDWFVSLEDHLRSVEEASAGPGWKRNLDTVIAPPSKVKRGRK